MTGPDRLPPIPEDAQTPAQRAASAEFESRRGNTVFGPFVPLLRSPELMLRLQAVGAYCRYENALGLTLSEFTILIVARHYGNDVEWAIHAPIAERAGVTAETIAAIAEGRRPAAMSAEEALVFDAANEILTHHRLSDATYAALVARFDEHGLVDLVGTLGYYATLALVMNVARTAAPEGPRLPAL